MDRCGLASLPDDLAFYEWDLNTPVSDLARYATYIRELLLDPKQSPQIDCPTHLEKIAGLVIDENKGMFEDRPSSRPPRLARAPLYPGHMHIVSTLETSLFMQKHDGSLSCMVTDLFYTESADLPAIVHVGKLMLQSFDTLLTSLDPEDSDELSDEDSLPVKAKGKSLPARSEGMKKPLSLGRAKKPVTSEHRENLNFKNKLCNDFSFEANSYFM